MAARHQPTPLLRRVSLGRPKITTKMLRSPRRFFSFFFFFFPRDIHTIHGNPTMVGLRLTRTWFSGVLTAKSKGTPAQQLVLPESDQLTPGPPRSMCFFSFFFFSGYIYISKSTYNRRYLPWTTSLFCVFSYPPRLQKMSIYERRRFALESQLSCLSTEKRLGIWSKR